VNVDPAILLVVATGSLVLATVVLAFATHQIASSTERATGETSNQSASDLVLQADRLLVEHPELLPFLRKNAEVGVWTRWTNKVFRTRIQAATEFYLDVLEAIWDHQSDFKGEDREAWREWIHSALEGSLTMRTTYEAEEASQWYPSLRNVLEYCSQPKHLWVRKRGAATMPATRPGPDRSRDGRLFVGGLAGGVLGNAVVAMVASDLDTTRWVGLFFLVALMLGLMAVAFTATDLIAAPFDWLAVTLVGISLTFALLSFAGLTLGCTFCGASELTVRAALSAFALAVSLWVLRLVAVPTVGELLAVASAIWRRWSRSARP
jgi:hypothetical protein